VPSEVSPPRVEGRLVVLSAGSTKLEGGQTFALAPVTIIGRAPGSQVRLNDAMVSAEHARLRRRNGRWFVQDLGSTNGTLLNQQPVQGERPIEYGDMITIGDVRLKLAR
jgi:pSer/pThr/pTyr-binding forkhead associated (FHA) protein